MTSRYYLGWFSEYFPEALKQALQQDVMERTSLVMISSDPEDKDIDGATEKSWLDDAGIVFESYTLINNDIPKDDAHSVIQSASVLFFLGGDPITQHRFIQEYNLKDALKESSAVIIGASAGAINLSKSWMTSRKLGFDVEETRQMDGIGFDPFGVLSHFDLENQMEVMRDELRPLADEMPVYASNKDCAIRVKEGRIDVCGDVYLLFGADCQQVEETL